MEIKDYLEVNQTRLYYAIQGEGEPLILLHGSFTDHRIWDEQAQSLAARFKVIRLDQRGYGNSDLPREPFAYYEDLKTLIDTLGLNDVNLVGSSFGGSVVIDFTLKYPEMVKKLVLAAPALNGYRYPLSYLFAYLRFLFALQHKGFTVAIEKFITGPFWGYFFPSYSKKGAQEKLLSLVRSSKRSFSWDPRLAKTLQPAAARRLTEINIPALIVLGDSDSAFNLKAGDYITQKIKRARKITMPGCGHLPYLEEPETFNGLLINLLNEDKPTKAFD
jgi:pimeloyl-ACP methyl ester carboxylesterase